MSGLEAPAAVVGLLAGAFQALQAAVQAIEFFNTAQHLGPDGDFFRTGLEFQKYRLIVWAQRVGLDRDCPRSALNPYIAELLLRQLAVFMTSAEKLRARYSLDITEDMVQEAEKLKATQPPSKGIGKLIARLKPTVYTTSAQLIQASNTPIKRLYWATRDKEKLKRILGDISELIDKLEVLLGNAERLAGRTEYEDLMHEVVSLTSTTAEAGQIGELVGNGPHMTSDEAAIKAAAYVKQIRLLVGIDKRRDEIKPTTSSETVGLDIQTLNVLKRSLSPWEGESLRYEGLELATYKKTQVLIQWAVAEGTQWEMRKGQIKCLAMLLGSLRDESFHSLPCRGYFPLQSQGRHGIVYDVPDPKVNWEFRTLKSLIADHPYLSLGRRLGIARAIAKTVYQLHTAGWMHKSLRSENIIFMAPKGSDSATFLSAEPIMVGYDYARADNEDAAIAHTQLPDTGVEADLYRHPNARGPNRETYQKRFDLYSLGCLLTELAGWRHLVEIMSSYVTPGLAKSIMAAEETNDVIELPTMSQLIGNKEAMSFLEFRAGERVRDVIVLSCSVGKAEEGAEGLLKEQVEVVRSLDLCKV